jgi:hypothetical protein
MSRALTLSLILGLATAARAETTGPATPEPPRATQAEVTPPPSPPKPAPQAKTADGKPLPEVPEIADEPLPQWSAPMARPKAVFLSVHPEVKRSQQLRQAGLWMASIGGAALLTSGILYAHALTVNGDMNLGCEAVLGFSMQQCDGRFHPALEDEKDRYATSAITLMAVGGTLVGTGIAVFGLGQWQLRRWHHRHPTDPLPPLSGY